MPYDTKYALIDISTFTEKAAMVEGIYQYIIQSAWAVTSLTASNFLGVGITGISPVDWNTSTFPYIAWINGSTYIQSFCLLNGNVSMSKSLDISGNLTVNGNTTISNLFLENVNINSDVFIGNNLAVNNDLYVSNNTYSINLNVSNNTNTYALKVTTMAVLNNVSINNASIINASINNVSINNVSINNATIVNVSINNASITYINISKSTIYNLSVENISSNNFSANSAIIKNASIENASFNTIRVNQNVSVGDSIRALNIYSNNISNSDNILSNNINIVNNASFNNLNVSGKTTLYAGLKENMPLNIFNKTQNASVPDIPPANATTMDVYIYPPTFARYLIVDTLYCDTIKPRGANITSYSDIGFMSINRQIIQDIDGTLLLGDTGRPIIYNAHTCGTISHGIGSTLNNITTTFDLSANSADIGIIYNGPVNIGTKNRNTFNLNATGNMSYEGIVDISGSLLLNGNINITNDILLGGNITSYSDIKLKDNITKLTNCLNKIEYINGYSYTRNDLNDLTKPYIGLIAQEVETIYPEIVENNNNIKSINYQSIIAILVECVKELKCEINKLKS
jgi:hypothetical protein